MKRSLKNNISIKGLSKYSLGENFDDLKFNIIKKDDQYKFDSVIEINNSPIILKVINYIKEKQIPSSIRIKGNYLKNKAINLEQISYYEKDNFFEIFKLKLNHNFKILDVDKIKINYLNQQKKLNNLTIKKNKQDYVLLGKSLDSSKLIDDLFINTMICI